MEAAITAGAFLVLWVANIRTSAEQRRQGGGSLSRLLAVSAGVTLLVVSPIVVWAMLELLGQPIQHGLFVSICSAVLSFFVLASLLRPPVHLQAQRLDLPPVDDEEILSAVSALSERLGIPAPRVRLLSSASSALEANAFAGGLPAPSLVVADGILHRLEPQERNAVIGHELAHISTGSLWTLALAAPLASVAAVVCGIWHPVWVSLPLGAAVFTGLRRVISRRVETHCDLAAGRVVGHVEMANAVAKVHAVHPLPDQGLISFLAYASATHPSLVRRKAALHAAAPPERRHEIQIDSRLHDLRRIGSWSALVVWALGLVLGFAVAFHAEMASLAILFSLALLPTIFILIGVRGRVRRRRRMLAGQRRTGRTLKLVGLCMWMGAGTLLLVRYRTDLLGDDLFMGPLLMMILLVGVVLSLVARYAYGNTNRLQIDFAKAFREQDYARVVAIGRANRKVKTSPMLLHDWSLALAITGDPAAAIRELNTLIVMNPEFPLPFISLASVQLMFSPEAALQNADHAAALVPDDPSPQILRARALRRLGRGAEAEAAIRRAVDLDPTEGTAHAVASWVAADRNDLEEARRRNALGEKHSPGDISVHVGRLLIELAADPASQAVGDALAAAERAAAANPFAFIEGELGELRDRAAEAQEAVGP